MKTKNTQKVVIAGNGYLPYLAALFLARKLKRNAPELLIVDLGKPSLPEWLQSLGSMKLFHSNLDLSEVDFVQRTQAEINLGFDYLGFSRLPHSGTGAESGEIFSDTQYGFDLGNHRFPYLFHKLRQTLPHEKLEDYCLSAKLARVNRFTPPSPKARSIYAGIHYGYRLTGEAYREFLAAKLPASNVRIAFSTIKSVNVDGKGFIESLDLSEGETVTGDLFIDASESRILRNAFGGADNFPLFPENLEVKSSFSTNASSESRPCSKIVATRDHLQISGTYLGRDHQTAISMSSMLSSDRTRHFADKAPWVNNCITLGLAFTNRIPILIDNSHIHQNALLRLLELWPRSDSMASEARAFNANTFIELRHLVDMDLLHLAQAFNRLDILSEDMRYKLDIYKHSGKVAYYEKEMLQAQQWPVLFNALGITPDVVDLSVKNCADSWLRDELFRIKSTLAKAAESAPFYRDFIGTAHR